MGLSFIGLAMVDPLRHVGIHLPAASGFAGWIPPPSLRFFCCSTRGEEEMFPSGGDGLHERRRLCCGEVCSHAISLASRFLLVDSAFLGFKSRDRRLCSRSAHDWIFRFLNSPHLL